MFGGKVGSRFSGKVVELDSRHAGINTGNNLFRNLNGLDVSSIQAVAEFCYSRCNLTIVVEQRPSGGRSVESVPYRTRRALSVQGVSIDCNDYGLGVLTRLQMRLAHRQIERSSRTYPSAQRQRKNVKTRQSWTSSVKRDHLLTSFEDKGHPRCLLVSGGGGGGGWGGGKVDGRVTERDSFL
jgi:hypothetical protein